MYFMAGVEKKNSIYFSSRGYNGLFLLKDDTLSLIDVFNKEKNKNMLHRKAFYLNERIWFMPWEGTLIARADVSSGDIDYIQIDGMENINEKWIYDYRIVDERFVYAVTKQKKLIRIDTIVGTASVIADYEKELSGCIAIGTVVMDDYIYFCTGGGHMVKVYDTKKNTCCLDENSLNIVDEMDYISILETDDRIWFVPFEKKCVLSFEKITRTKNYFEIGGCTSKNMFFDSMDVPQGVLFFPVGDNRIIASIQNNEIEFKKIPQTIKKDNEWYEMCSITSYKKINRYAVSNDGIIWKINKDNEMYLAQKLVLSKDIKKQLLTKYSQFDIFNTQNSEIIKEDDEMNSIDFFINMISKEA